MKKFLALILIAVMALGIFASCDVDVNCSHEDEDADHKCEACGQKLSACYDINNDHICEYCTNTISKCSDDNNDHLCDVCRVKLSECKNEDGNHACDICGAALGACVDADKNHVCESCGVTIAECADLNSDHKCDVCGVKISSCKNENGDHACDLCKATMSICSDSDKDHACDICAKAMSQCEDSNNDHVCEYCNKKISECEDLDYNAKCDVCGGHVELPQYIRNGNKITFGSYPQTEVTDSSLKTALNNKAGTLPTSSNSRSWISYGYYINNSQSNFMWYIDIEHDGEKYRGVYFTSYRPNYTSNSSSASNSYQDNNGYNTGNVYWFKYEPISWTVLDENTSEKTAFILCDMIIDSQEYYLTDSGTRNIGGETVYPNDYAQSTIRKWLNETFYNTAFNQLQRAIILTTSVDNSAATTGSTNNSYACEDTQDKIFLLSYEEATNGSYGLNSTVERRKKTTDYAKSQGVYIYSTNGSYAENGDWWLRSPYSSYNNRVRYLEYDGYLHYYYVDRVNVGVVPALKIKL